MESRIFECVIISTGNKKILYKHYLGDDYYQWKTLYGNETYLQSEVEVLWEID